MLLAIDIGNSNIVVALFSDNKLESSWRLPTHKTLDSDELFKTDTGKINKVVFASVVPDMDNVLIKTCQEKLDITPYKVTHESKLNITLDIDSPEKAGTDRILNAAAAYEKYKEDLIVDIVLKEGKFIGGMIVPGLVTAADNLFKNASKLTKIELEKPAHVIGRNTKDALNSGLYFGYLGLLESLIKRAEKETDRKLTIVLTGGLAPLFVEEFEKQTHHEPNLTLQGLNLISQWNS